MEGRQGSMPGTGEQSRVEGRQGSIPEDWRTAHTQADRGDTGTNRRRTDNGENSQTGAGESGVKTLAEEYTVVRRWTDSE